jgi:hypothetical protein
MRHHHVSKAIALATSMLAITVALAAQSQDRFTLQSSNGIAFAEFKGYDAWQLIATSQHDGADGCGTSTNGCMKAIVGNPIIIKAFRDGIPANGKPFPDGAAMAKIEWLKDTNESAPYQITVPGEETEVAFMVKNSKRFTETNGWGYATLSFDGASNTYQPKAGQKDSSFAKACDACHSAGAKTTDFVYTSFARR